MAEMPQYHIAQMVRRLRGGRLSPRATHCDEMVERIAKGEFAERLASLKAMSEVDLKEAYKARENEPDLAEEMWEPEDKTYL